MIQMTIYCPLLGTGGIKEGHKENKLLIYTPTRYTKSEKLGNKTMYCEVLNCEIEITYLRRKIK